MNKHHLARLRVVFRLPESGGRHAGLPAVRRDPRLHADVAAGRAHHAVAVRHRRPSSAPSSRPMHSPPASRACSPRDSPTGSIARSCCSSSMPASSRGTAWCGRREQLRIAAAGAHRHRPVRRRHRLGRARHRDRPVRAADARPRHGLHPDGVRRQPDPRHPDRHLSIEPLELACAVPRAGGARRSSADCSSPRT